VNLTTDEEARRVYRWVLGMGWGEEAAGRWAAWSAGIRHHEDEEGPTAAWTLADVERLYWLRWMVETGRVEP
jgi:hypothetical protein